MFFLEGGGLALALGLGLNAGKSWAVCRMRRRATLAAPPAEGIADLPQDSRYETALAGAQAIIHQFADRADMPEHERLARVTYAILDAMHRHGERRQAGAACPEPSVNA